MPVPEEILRLLQRLAGCSWGLTLTYDPDALCDVCHKKDRVKRHYLMKWTLCESCYGHGWRPPRYIKICGDTKFLTYTTATCSLTVPFPG